jgi:transposase-like protein
MSIHISAESIQGKQQKEIIKEIKQKAKEAALYAVKEVLEAGLEAEVEHQLGRKKGGTRCISSQPRQSEWRCGHCGCQDANQFLRDGHYRRNLETGWGHIQGLRVPMVECQKCFHDVICHFSLLEKFQRLWIDLEQDALFSSGLGQSLRSIVQRWSAQTESNVGLRALNERINHIEPLIQQMREQAITPAPPIVQLDGIWVTIQHEADKSKPDAKKRQRKQRTGKKQVILVALAFWEDGRREVLDWHIAPSEEHTHWEVLLNRLWRRGVQPEKGLKMSVRDGCGGLEQALAQVYGPDVLDQRCVFHKLHNAGSKVRSELKGKERQEERKQLMKEASAIYQAETASQAQQRLQAWAQRWQGRAPDAVATLTRDFEATVVFYQLDTITREWIRTTSLLERANRAFRTKFRQAVTFGSHIGAEVAVYLQVLRLHTHWTKGSWWEVSHDLPFALRELHP